MTAEIPPFGPTAESLLEELRDHPEWDETRVAEQFDRLIARFSPGVLAETIRPRLGDLGGGDGEILLQLIEALATPALLDALADALAAQTSLTPDRQWQALGVLEGS